MQKDALPEFSIITADGQVAREPWRLFDLSSRGYNAVTRNNVDMVGLLDGKVSYEALKELRNVGNATANEILSKAAEVRDRLDQLQQLRVLNIRLKIPDTSTDNSESMKPMPKVRAPGLDDEFIERFKKNIGSTFDDDVRVVDLWGSILKDIHFPNMHLIRDLRSVPTRWLNFMGSVDVKQRKLVTQSLATVILYSDKKEVFNSGFYTTSNSIPSDARFTDMELLRKKKESQIVGPRIGKTFAHFLASGFVKNERLGSGGVW